jgi:hypothetical protein
VRDLAQLQLSRLGGWDAHLGPQLRGLGDQREVGARSHFLTHLDGNVLDHAGQARGDLQRVSLSRSQLGKGTVLLDLGPLGVELGDVGLAAQLQALFDDFAASPQPGRPRLGDPALDVAEQAVLRQLPLGVGPQPRLDVFRLDRGDLGLQVELLAAQHHLQACQLGLGADQRVVGVEGRLLDLGVG